MRFISFPTKILTLTLLLMLSLLIVITSMSLQRLNQSFVQQQQLKQQQLMLHLSQYQILLNNQQQVWFESFAELTTLQQQAGFEHFMLELSQRVDSLTLHLNLEALWFFTDSNTAAYQTAPFPNELLPIIEQTKRELRPHTVTFCTEHCSSFVSLPLSDAVGNIAVLISSQTLADIVIALGQALESEVAVIRFDQQHLKVLSATMSAQNELQDVVTALEKLDAAGLHELILRGFIFADIPYFVHLLPLVKQEQQQFAILLLEDTQEFQSANQIFKWRLLTVAVLCFILFSLLTFWLTRRLTKRLLQISHALPLLAENKFPDFRAALPKNSSLLNDEVDRLHQVSQALSCNLEQLQNNIAIQTEELEKMAMFDLLTGLANRNMLYFQLKKRIATLDAQGEYLGVLYLDIDQFKRVNDIRGHDQGDQFLIAAAFRLKSALPSTDLVCRFGGDEFVVVTNVQNPEQLSILAQQLIDDFRQPMKLINETYQLNISVGISCSQNNTLTPDDLVRQADLAMYQAKAKGGNSWHCYTQQMFEVFQSRLQLEVELKQALLQQQFLIYAQPQISLQTKQLTGLEVLLRWQSPSRGMVPPDEFITILEHAHLMIPVGYWVIEESFKLLLTLKAAEFSALTIAINLSASQLNDPKLADLLQSLLLRYQLEASDFELELTENLLVNSIGETISSMQRLKALGFRLAIDDFGTGYSSLSYLRQMPVDTIKIDKSFVFGMLDNKADFDIITSTIDMVRKLGLAVVAEGVETEAQCLALVQHHCDIGQGYLFAKPLPSADIVSQLHGRIDEQGGWF